jgi:hypothetical protein
VEREPLSITHNLDILRQNQPLNFFGDKCARQKYYSGLNKVVDRRIVRISKDKRGVESERVRIVIAERRLKGRNLRSTHPNVVFVESLKTQLSANTCKIQYFPFPSQIFSSLCRRQNPALELKGGKGDCNSFSKDDIRLWLCTKVQKEVEKE